MYGIAAAPIVAILQSVAAAKRRLQCNHPTVQEIGEAMGYHDVAFFPALFP
jgi:hypothetical protein